MTLLHFLRHYARMSTRVQDTVVRRPSLPLTRQDEADLTRLRATDEGARAVEAIAAMDVSSATESAFLLAIFRAGLRSIEHELERAGYAQIAAQAEQAGLERRSTARRRRPGWADEP